MLRPLAFSQEQSNKKVPKLSTCDSIGSRTKPPRDNSSSSGNQVNTIWWTTLPSTTLELTIGLYHQSTFTTTTNPRTIKRCIEILTCDSNNPGPTKPITSERIQWIKPVTNNRTKRAHIQPLRGRAHTAPPNCVSTVDTHASTDRTNMLVTKT